MLRYSITTAPSMIPPLIFLHHRPWDRCHYTVCFCWFLDAPPAAGCSCDVVQNLFEVPPFWINYFFDWHSPIHFKNSIISVVPLSLCIGYWPSNLVLCSANLSCRPGWFSWCECYATSWPNLSWSRTQWGIKFFNFSWYPIICVHVVSVTWKYTCWFWNFC